MEKFIKLSKELEEKVNCLLEKMGHGGEFWIVCANKTGYTVYAENVCFDVLDE